MTRCKISPAMEAVLLDSIKAGKLHASLETPEGKFNNGDVPSLLASALEDFKDRQWYAFGSQLGVAMQDMLFVTFDRSTKLTPLVICASASLIGADSPIACR